MTRQPLWALAAAASLAACATQPPASPPSTGPGAHDAAVPGMPADGQVYPNGNTYRVLATEELPIVAVAVDSETLSKARLADGDLATQWTNGGYRNATAWAAVALSGASAIGSVGLKTGPSAAGTSYDLQVSDDGATWRTVLANQTNTSWNLETKTLPAGTTGRHVRVFWHNSASAPQAHFSIYELQVNGTAGTAPSPTPSPTPTATPTPTPTPSVAPTTAPSPGGTAQKLPLPASFTNGPSYNGLSPTRAMDGDLATQWASGEYKAAEAFFQLNYAQSWAFSEVRVKTGALPQGVTYRIEVSDDNRTWRDASGPLTNTTWNLEPKAVNAGGQFLRLRFVNNPSNPIARFSIYEVEVYGRSQANQPPTIQAMTQTPMFVEASGTGTLRCAATDPDGDPLTYTWEMVPPDWDTRPRGTVTGNGPEATFQPEDVGPTSSDGRVKVTVRDGRGGEASQIMDVRVYFGSTVPLNANQALEWDPAKTASAAFSGDVTVNASGDFAGYDAVICEYTTTEGRRMALLPPGTTTVPGVTGYMYMYLLGPTGGGLYHPEEPNFPGPYIPEPSISLQLSDGRGAVSRMITQANVVGSHQSGVKLESGNHGPWFYAGENTAKNGARPYERLLEIYTSEIYEDEISRYRLHIYYSLHQPGDYLPGSYQGGEEAHVLLTDSLGGLGDNTGAWTLYESGKYMGPYE